MANKCNLDEYAVIERYEECETARIVAQEFDVSTETIYRILKRNGVKRTHRHEQKAKVARVSNCSSKYCAALVVMLREILGMTTSSIREATGIPTNSISNIFNRKRPDLKMARCQRIDEETLNAIEADYLSGESTYAIGEKFGIHHATVSSLMRKLGHFRGKGQGPAIDRANEKKRIEADEKLLSEFGQKVLSSSKKDSQRRREIRMAMRTRDVGVTWRALAKRKGSLICDVCGVECNPGDKRWGSAGPTHPSVDHIKRICDGGTDTFDNARLVCCKCNLELNVIAERRARENAKEQAIAHKCA